MVADARLQVREDREKVALFRTERSKQLDQVRLLDHRVSLWERAVQDGAAAVVKLVQRQKWQQHEAERAAIAREATRPMSPARAKNQLCQEPIRVKTRCLPSWAKQKAAQPYTRPPNGH